MKTIIVIDNNREDADIWCREIRTLGGIPIPVVADDAAAISVELDRLMKADEKEYDGVILDIMFKGEPRGGITLWNTIPPSWKKRMGKLMVGTKGDGPDLVAFAYAEAGGRLCQSCRRDHKQAHLKACYF